MLTGKGNNLLVKSIGFEENDLLTMSINSLGLQKSQELDRLLQELLRLMSPEIDLFFEVQENLDHQEQTKGLIKWTRNEF